MLYVIDDQPNYDDDEGCYRWIVTNDETGEDDDAIIARFKQEKMAELFVEYANSNEDDNGR